VLRSCIFCNSFVVGLGLHSPPTPLLPPLSPKIDSSLIAPDERAVGWEGVGVGMPGDFLRVNFIVRVM